MITVIIPVYNEESVIAECLSGLLAQTCESPVQVIVSANGCIDNSVVICESFRALFDAKGYDYLIIENVESGKARALNLADSHSIHSARLYLDADVVCSEDFLQQAIPLLNLPYPLYFSGVLRIQDNPSFCSSAYGMIWKSLPYIRDTVVGIGCYGVNAAGRQKWNKFPAIHSDDKFVRLLFDRSARRRLLASYAWPVPEGVLTLIKVRVRWIKGNRELNRSFPSLFAADVDRLKVDRKSIATMLFNPVATLIFLLVYGAAAAASLVGQDGIVWSRAR